jgi:hypothetical protein
MGFSETCGHRRNLGIGELVELKVANWLHLCCCGPLQGIAESPITELVLLSVMAANLASLLTASKALNSHIQRPDLPSVNLSLDQIEAQSRRLVARQPGAAADSGRGCV